LTKAPKCPIIPETSVAQREKAVRELFLLILAFLFALAGQRQFAGEGYVHDALILYTVGCVLLAIAAKGEEATSPPEAPSFQKRLSKRELLAGFAGVALVLMATAIFAGEKASNEALVLWLAGIALFVYAFARPPRPHDASHMLRWLKHRREVLALILILAVAFFMRAYRLDAMPPGLYLDEADNGLWGLRFLEMPYSPFTEHRDSNATLFYYLLGLALKLGGVRVIVMRWFDVVVGIITVAVFYLLARLLFGVPAALVATFLLAVARWHVNFSRIVFVEILPVPLFEALVVYFLWRGMNEGKRHLWAWAGLLFGLGFHTYIGYRAFPLVVGAFLAYVAVRRRGWLRAHYHHVLLFLLATFITLAPLAVYAVRYPRVFTRRVKAASVLNDIEREGSYRPLWENFRKTFLMFNYKGDPRPRHNLPNEPMLDFWTAIFFGLGFGYSLIGAKREKHFLLLAWLLFGFLPGALSLADSNPHSSRTLGNVIPVFLMVAAFWERAIVTVDRALGRLNRKPAWALAGCLLLLAAYNNYHVYFYRQANDPSVYYDFDPVPTQAGIYIKKMSPHYQLFVSQALTNHAAVKFIPYGLPYETLNLNAHIPVRENVQRDVIYVLEIIHSPYLGLLQRLYPNGVLEEHQDRYGQLMFYTFKVSQEDILAAQGVTARYYAGSEPDGAPAMEIKDLQIAHQWDSPPMPPPFTVVWEAALYAPEYGEYRFSLSAGGRATLSLDNQQVLSVKEGTGEAVRLLTAGFHALEVVYTQETQKGHIYLHWILPDGERELIPRSAFYDPSLARLGLVGRYYRGMENWSGTPEIVRIDPFITANDLLPAPFSI